ncbi:SDR family NAD(P)-dependent oxidoreductase [Pseudofrankia inefficax]|uniref:SDR family NAD(P)-dependent oxidoreductase n=1 Tax=Pseudofrankia inefficax (strain DSM 45817 / CECT 9037 / DDB 130130 / EuI1c) TaxID=298654 RepID=UPI0003191E7C|nr:SDR family oxidoreductase [Pseudofrankia inefficax]
MRSGQTARRKGRRRHRFRDGRGQGNRGRPGGEGARVVTNNRKPGSVGLSSWANSDDTESLLTDDDRRLIESLSGDARTTADQIVAEGGEAVPFFGDPGDVNVAGALVQTAVEAWGRVDIPQTHAKLTGTYNTMHHALPLMRRQGFGRVLNASSDAWVGLPMLAAYSAANAGVVGLTRAVAQEVRGSGITCNVFCPRSISRNHVNWRASMRRQLAKGGPEMEALRHRLEREDRDHQAPENLGPFLAYLASDAAAGINGEVFSVTAGGRVAQYDGFTIVSEIEKREAPWTVDELETIVPEVLLKAAARGRPETAEAASTARLSGRLMPSCSW